MKLILFVLHDPEKLRELLDAWTEAGISGATVLYSTGLGRLNQAGTLRDDLPLMPSLEDFLPKVEHLSRTIFSMIDDEAVVNAAEDVAEARNPVVAPRSSGGICGTRSGHRSGVARRRPEEGHRQQFCRAPRRRPAGAPDFVLPHTFSPPRQGPPPKAGESVGRISVLSSSLAVQSQRDCALQPKVAPLFRGYLGSTSGNGNNANGVVAGVTGPRARNGRNRAAVGNGWGR